MPQQLIIMDLFFKEFRKKNAKFILKLTTLRKHIIKLQFLILVKKD